MIQPTMTLAETAAAIGLSAESTRKILKTHPALARRLGKFWRVPQSSIPDLRKAADERKPDAP